MHLSRVRIQDLITFDESNRENLEPGRTAYCAVVAGPGVSKELAEQFSKVSYKRGVIVDVFTYDQAPRLLFSPASQDALQAPTPTGVEPLPIMADDMSKLYESITNLTVDGEELVVFEYKPGEDWTESFSW